MGSRPPKPNLPSVAVQLRRRAVLRFTVFSSIAALCGAVVLDHSGCFGYRGDDWPRFDRRSVRIIRVTEGDLVTVRTTDGNREAVVQLLGVDAPHDIAGNEAREFTHVALQDKIVTLRLDPLVRRNAAGHLQAYLYLNDGDLFNVDLVHAGLAYADRRIPHTLRAPIEGAESDARRHRRGLWRTITEPQMPAWRQQWMKEQRDHHRTVE